MPEEEYIAPECKWDFPAAFRADILKDVLLHGEADRSSTEMSNAFSGWDHGQIYEWCQEHNLAIVARHDGRIIVYSPIGNTLRIHAEVEAMDWSEVIDG